MKTVAKQHRVKLGSFVTETFEGTKNDIVNFANAMVASGEWRGFGHPGSAGSVAQKIYAKIVSVLKRGKKCKVVLLNSPTLAVFEMPIMKVVKHARKPGYVQRMSLILAHVQIRILKDNHEEIRAANLENERKGEAARKAFMSSLGNQALLSPEANRTALGGKQITRRQALKGLGDPKTWAAHKKKVEAEFSKPRGKK